MLLEAQVAWRSILPLLHFVLGKLKPCKASSSGNLLIQTAIWTVGFISKHPNQVNKVLSATDYFVQASLCSE